jgi:hypothetical protein
MPVKNKRSLSDPDFARILRGGKAVPGELVRRCVADLQSRRKADLERRSATEGKMAKLFGQARGPLGDGNPDPPRPGPLQGLLDMHRKLAKQKLAAPKVPGGLGGLLPGQIVVTTVPPFDYNVIIPGRLAGHDAALEGASDKNTGMMSASAISASPKGFNGGSMYTTVGVYFHPFGPGTLTVHATPRYSFQWWTNSIGANSLVRSFGSGGLTVYGVDVAAQTTGGLGTIVSIAHQSFGLWDENLTDQVRFDFGFDLQAPVSVQLDVNHDLVYLLFVEADVHVEGIGWPGSLAGAKMAVTVPSLTYDFRMQQVFQA